MSDNIGNKIAGWCNFFNVYNLFEVFYSIFKVRGTKKKKKKERNQLVAIWNKIRIQCVSRIISNLIARRFDLFNSSSLYLFP